MYILYIPHRSKRFKKNLGYYNPGLFAKIVFCTVFWDCQKTSVIKISGGKKNLGSMCLWGHRHRTFFTFGETDASSLAHSASDPHDMDTVSVMSRFPNHK